MCLLIFDFPRPSVHLISVGHPMCPFFNYLLVMHSVENNHSLACSEYIYLLMMSLFRQVLVNLRVDLTWFVYDNAIILLSLYIALYNSNLQLIQITILNFIPMLYKE